VKYRNSIDISEVLYQFKEGRQNVGKCVRKNQKNSQSVKTRSNNSKLSYKHVWISSGTARCNYWMIRRDFTWSRSVSRNQLKIQGKKIQKKIFFFQNNLKIILKCFSKSKKKFDFFFHFFRIVHFFFFKQHFYKIHLVAVTHILVF